MFPQDYSQKLETDLTDMEAQVEKLTKTNKQLQNKVIRLTNEVDSKEFTNDKLIKLIEKGTQKITTLENQLCIPPLFLVNQ